MARIPSDAYELTDAEKRDLIKLINEGKPLPEKYRFLLFADKREVELVWNGKSREVCTAILPFQTLEHIDEPRKEKTVNEEFDFDTRGRQLKGWTNKLIWGDNKLILSSLKSGALRRQIEDAGGLKLIYIDPPFDVGADFSMDIEIGGETFHKEPNLLEQIAYRDTWGRGADSFIAMIYERLILMRDLLHSEGSIYVHCDWRVNSFVRLVMDEVFGREFFKNEITWKRQPPRGARAVASQNARTSDHVLYFTRGEQYRWNPQFKTILPEVFDKRAVEKGQVRFHDVAYIEVTPRFDQKNPLTVAVELTDFSVYYSQGLVDAITADLKEGKSEVVCEQGKLLKVSKDKQGIVTRDVLTKQWTDWVDYWAVDFDYESRKEIIKVQRGTGVSGVQGHLPGLEPAQRELDMPAVDFEERETDSYIFENEWQSFRTRQNRDLELITATHTYANSGRYVIAVKVIDIFGNDTMTLVPVTVG